MFEYLLKKNPDISELFTDEDKTFIKEMINPPKDKKIKVKKDKAYLYQVNDAATA